MVIHWSLLISACSTSISLIWRFIMLYFAYKRLIFSSKNNKFLNLLQLNNKKQQIGKKKNNFSHNLKYIYNFFFL